jgi:hypothetical protein
MKKYLEVSVLLLLSLCFHFVTCEGKGIAIPAAFSLLLLFVYYTQVTDISGLLKAVLESLPLLFFVVSQVALFWRPGTLRGVQWVKLLPPFWFLVREGQGGLDCPWHHTIFWGPVALYLLVFLLFRLKERAEKSDPA